MHKFFTLHKYPVIVQKKTLIANNTVESLVSEDFSGYEKDSFLFIGFLNRRKGLKILIEAFKTYFDSGNRNIKKMIIEDDGPEKKKITGMVNQLGIQLNVIFLGNINDQKAKLQNYKNAIASISPKQAALSLLECF